MMTVLVVGIPEGVELEVLRSRIQRNPHFQVISHARTPDVALAHARVLLPDITVLTLSGSFRDDPAAFGVFRGCAPWTRRAGWCSARGPTRLPSISTSSPSTGRSTWCARATRRG